MSQPASAFEDRWMAVQWSAVTQPQWRAIRSTGNQRQRLHKAVMNAAIDGGSGRSRAWTNAYELSQDLHAKQVEILEKKYGGPWRSRHAATIIQRAYRHYCLTRNFAKLRWEADEKRLSRRFAEFSHSKTVWSDLASTIQQEEIGNDNESIYSEYDNIMTHSYSSDNMLHYFMHQKTSRTILQTTTTTTRQEVHSTVTKKSGARNDALRSRRNLDLDLGKNGDGNEVVEIPVERVTVQKEHSYARKNGQQLELSDSGESVLSSPYEPMVDAPSACFENLLETQLTDMLDDSFTSDSCDDGDVTPVNESSNSELGHDYSSAKTTHDSEQSGQHGVGCRTSPASRASCMTSEPSTDCQTQIKSQQQQQKSLTDELPNSGETGEEAEDEQSSGGSPVWKRKSRHLDGVNRIVIEGPDSSQDVANKSAIDDRRTVEMDSVGEKKEASRDAAGKTSIQLPSSSSKMDSLSTAESSSQPKVSDRSRKRAYRIGLNLFNKKPENGVRYLIMRQFLDQRPNAVAKFLISRKGLSKQMIGEYLGNLQKPFNMEVLRCFANEIELSGLQIDVALRKFQSYFRMPGEAQKIERLMEAFATRYCQCNPEHVEEFRSSETVFLLAFAIIMLNTDLHNSNIKPDRKMKVTDFIRNLRGIDGGQDIEASLLSGIYERIRGCELKPGADHVSHVFRLEQMIFGNKPQISLPHRRLVCYCRMYEVLDPLKRDKVGQHQRELFLFNDILMVTKLFNKKKKKTPLYSFRQMFSLFGMVVHIFESHIYKYGLQLSANLGGNVLILLNARNEHDRTKFVDDLKESILEVTDMEGLRIEEELKKQKFCPPSANLARYSKDSGVVDIEMLKLAESSVNRLSAPECERLKKSPLCNSLVDITDNRRGSGVSLDSGVASAESESVGSCQEPNRSSRFLGLPNTTSALHGP